MRVVIENGRKRIIRSMQRDWRSWGVLIQDHHEGYIPWADFERNQHLIADNANGKRFMSRGAIRRGEALLAGLFRCARCGRASCPLQRWSAALSMCRSVQPTRRGAVYHLQRHAPGQDGVQGGARPSPTAGRGSGPGGDRRAQPEALGEARDQLEFARGKLATRRLVRSASTTPSIRTTGLWRASWSDGGMSAWSRCASSRSRLISSTP